MAKATKGGGGKGPKPQPATLSDLVLTIVDGVVTSTVSPDAQWASIQKFVDMSTSEGAVGIWEAQRYYDTAPGPGATTSCPVQGTGYYRGWTSDFDYDIHLSNVIFVP